MESQVMYLNMQADCNCSNVYEHATESNAWSLSDQRQIRVRSGSGQSQS